MAGLIPKRVQSLMDQRNMSQAELARRVGIAQPSINRMLKGETRNPRFLHDIARELQTTTAYLLGEIDSSAPGNQTREAARGYRGAEPETVDVAQIDLRFGLGSAYMDQEVVEGQLKSRPFPVDWLRSITTAAPSQLYWARGVGDSMEPKIGDGDVILIDRSDQGATFGDLYWAISYGQTGMIKRLRPMADGSVKILSNNPSVPPEIAYDGELHIFGRVIAVVKKI